VPSSQALPGFLITAPPFVLAPAVLGALAAWIQNFKKKKCGSKIQKNLHVCAYAYKSKGPLWECLRAERFWVPYCCTPPVCVPVISALAVWRQNTKNKKVTIVSLQSMI